MEESIALIQFINARETGNILRDIAERRLCDLRRMENRIEPEPKLSVKHSDLEVMDVVSGYVYKNTSDAARFNGISKFHIQNDIYSGRFKYGLIPVRML